MEENHTVFVKGPPIKATAKITIKDFVEVIRTSKEGEISLRRLHGGEHPHGN